MVVLSAVVSTKAGKALVSRQFVPMPRSRIESYLAAFPKLIGTESEHTFVETENIRYVYQPLDQLYVMLITTKQSNIMEDLVTLRLCSKVVSEFAKGNTEALVIENAFELTFAFDEIISIGYKENVTLEQIRTFTEMDSHEEKLQKIIQESKMNEARDEMKRKSRAIEKKKKEERKIANEAGSGGGRSGGGGRGGGGNSYSGAGESRYGGGSGGSGGSGRNNNSEKEREAPKKAASKPKPKSSGWSLSKGKKKDDFYSKMAKEENLTGPSAPVAQGRPGKSSQQASIMDDAPKDKIFVTIKEDLTLTLEKEGGVKKLDLKGEMKVAIFDPDDAKIVITTNGPLDKADGYKCRLHPKINTKVFNKEGILGLKDASKPFPVGSENAAIILKWRLQSTDESLVPFTLNFWPNAEDGKTVVSAEYAVEKDDLTLTDVSISIPCPEAPDVANVDGDFHYDNRNKILVWTIPEISADNDSGSLEFSITECDDDDLYPINIDFTSDTTYCKLEVLGIERADDSGEAVDYELRQVLKTDKFIISD